jgi:hypothetical protein
MIILSVQPVDSWFRRFTSLVFYLLPNFGYKIDVRWGHVRISLADYVAWVTDNVSVYKMYVGKHQGK